MRRLLPLLLILLFVTGADYTPSQDIMITGSGQDIVIDSGQLFDLTYQPSYSDLLIRWAADPSHPHDVVYDAGTATYSLEAAAARATLVADGWTITDGGCEIPDLILDIMGDVGVTKDGSNYLTAWDDQSGQGNNGTQVTAVRRPLWVDAAQNGLPIIRFTKSNNVEDDGVFFTGLTSVVQSYTIIFVHKPTNVLSAATEYIMDIQTGRLLLYHILNNQTGWGDGVCHHGVPPTGAGTWQTATFQFTKDGDGEFFRNGVSQGTGAVGNRNIGGLVSIGSRHAIAGGHFCSYAGDMAQVLIWERVLTPAELAIAWAYINTKWGL